jgi:eukaryotic-like serine/threonine-protein kinase
VADETICPKCNAQNPKDTVFCGKCGTKIPQTTAEQQAVDPLIGSFVGDRFLVHQKLGEGGMGVVYRAEQTAIKREVALKVLHTDLNDDSLFARFQNEAAAASRLNHPNTITIYDFGRTESKSLYIAMEFIKGISLDDEIRDIGAMPVARACHIGVQICGSLQDAHNHSIVHRDLKPENVMLCERAGETDVVKVLDFGIAKIVEDDGQDQRKALTKTGMVFGTPQYMSPEQIRGEKVDHRSDIYSLGVMLYQMVTGELPFTADTPMGLLTKHLMDTPHPLEPQGVPSEVADVIMTALEKEADKRPESMKALGAMLANASGIASETAAIAAAGVSRTQPQPTVSAKRARTGPEGSIVSSQKKPFPVVPVVIIAVLVLVGGAAAAWYFTVGRKPSASPSQVAATAPQAMAPPAQPTALAQLGGQQQAQQPAQPTVPVQPMQPLPSTMSPPNEGSQTAPKNDKSGAKPKKDPPKKAKPEKTPEKDPAPETPPEKTEPEKDNPDSPKKDVKCTFRSSKSSGSVSKSVISALKGREKAIRSCADNEANIRSIFQFTIEKNGTKPKGIKGAGTNSCVDKQLGAITIKPSDEGPTDLTAVFVLKKNSGIMEECSVNVRKLPSRVKGIPDKIKKGLSKFGKP